MVRITPSRNYTLCRWQSDRFCSSCRNGRRVVGGKLSLVQVLDEVVETLADEIEPVMSAEDRTAVWIEIRKQLLESVITEEDTTPAI